MGNTITLYHYTSESAAKSIKKSKRLNASYGSIKDAVWGDGVYFTDMDFSYGREKIAYNNWKSSYRTVKEKMEWCVVVSFHDYHVKDCTEDGRRIFLYPDFDVPLTEFRHEIVKSKW